MKKRKLPELQKKLRAAMRLAFGPGHTEVAHLYADLSYAIRMNLKEKAQRKRCYCGNYIDCDGYLPCGRIIGSTDKLNAPKTGKAKQKTTRRTKAQK